MSDDLPPWETPVERIPVPHVERDLAPRGLAITVPYGRHTAYKVLPEGQQLIDDAIRHNQGAPMPPPNYRREP